MNERTVAANVKGAYRAWLVTIFIADYAGPEVQHRHFRYFLAQKEVAPSTGAVHWQGYLETKDKTRMAMVKEILRCPGAHCEPRRGTQEEAIAYCTKEDTRATPHEKLEFGEKAKVGAPGKGSRRGGGSADATCWTRALDAEAGYEEALEIIKAGDPRAFLLYGQQIKLNLQEEKKPARVFEPQYTKCPWLESADMKRWREEELPKKERAKCLVLVGPTRLGKTQWARHLFPTEHIYYRGMTNFRKWNDAAKLLVLDDIPWEFIPQKKSLLTQMGECEVTDKYTPKKTLWVSMPAVVLLNEVPNFAPEDRYWAENAMVVVIEDPLYDPDWRLEVPPSPASEELWDEPTQEFPGNGNL